jgi:hypothetical protein
MVSVGSTRTAARSRMGIKSGSMAPSIVDMNLYGLRRMEKLEARIRICGHGVMLSCHRG